MKQYPSISEAEYEVMKIIWKKAPVSTNQVVDEVLQTSDWSPKTIQTMLARLVKKGIIETRKQSRVYIYTPLVEEKEYLSQESSHFLQRFYDGAIESMVLNFIQEDKLSKDEIVQLKSLLEDKLDKKGGQ